MKVVQRTPQYRRPAPKVGRVIKSKQVRMDSAPITVGEPHQTIQIVPIMENGRIKALKATCSCGSESIYDIQYTDPKEATR